MVILGQKTRLYRHAPVVNGIDEATPLAAGQLVKVAVRE